jgi:ribosome-binding factor A
MPKRANNSNRPERIAAKVQMLVAEILRDEFSDDAVIKNVSLAGSVAHGGMQFVKLYYHFHGADHAPAGRRLDNITKMVRFELARRMNQKYVPEIRFEYDDTLERASRIDALLGGVAGE